MHTAWSRTAAHGAPAVRGAAANMQTVPATLAPLRVVNPEQASLMFAPLMFNNASFPARNRSYTIIDSSGPFSPPRGAFLLTGAERWACGVGGALPAVSGGAPENVTVTAGGNFTFMPQCGYTGARGSHGSMACAGPCSLRFIQARAPRTRCTAVPCRLVRREVVTLIRPTQPFLTQASPCGPTTSVAPARRRRRLVTSP